MTQLHKLSPVAATIGTIQQFPALRGFWPMSGQDWDGTNCRYFDYSGAWFPMQASGLVNSQAALEEANEHYVPHVHMNAFSNSYLFHTDHPQFDITGLETFVASAQRGMTLGLWWHSDITPSSSGTGLMSKYYTVGSQRSFLLYITSGSPHYINALMAGAGAGPNYTSQAPHEVVIDQWNLNVMRFVPGTAVQHFSNGEWFENTTSIPASIFSGTARLEIGSYQNGLYPLNGGVSMVFICASAVHKKMIENLWEISREMFGR